MDFFPLREYGDKMVCSKLNTKPRSGEKNVNHNTFDHFACLDKEREQRVFVFVGFFGILISFIN